MAFAWVGPPDRGLANFRELSTWHTDVPVPYLDTEGAIAARGGGLHTFLSSAPLKKGVWG